VETVSRFSRRAVVTVAILGFLHAVTRVAPAAAASQTQAVTGCAQHCKKIRSLGEASRCCGVESRAGDAARLTTSDGPERPSRVLVAVLPPTVGRLIATAGATPAVAPTTGDIGPPVFLRLQTLLL